MLVFFLALALLTQTPAQPELDTADVCLINHLETAGTFRLVFYREPDADAEEHGALGDELLDDGPLRLDGGQAHLLAKPLRAGAHDNLFLMIRADDAYERDQLGSLQKGKLLVIEWGRGSGGVQHRWLANASNDPAVIALRAKCGVQTSQTQPPDTADVCLGNDHSDTIFRLRFVTPSGEPDADDDDADDDEELSQTDRVRIEARKSHLFQNAIRARFDQRMALLVDATSMGMTSTIRVDLGRFEKGALLGLVFDYDMALAKFRVRHVWLRGKHRVGFRRSCLAGR